VSFLEILTISVDAAGELEFTSFAALTYYMAGYLAV
jgi:hypothetical protein